jgi:peptidoglycan hydrolase-like protein with peptidoglycan-binding domain
MAAKRINVLYAALGAIAAAASGAWWAGSRIESPAEVAARTAPPPPSPVLVPVERRVLSADVVTRGTVRFGLPQPISIAPSALKASAGLVTTLPVRNSQVEQGDVLLTASGRPVFVLQGEVPVYRDLVPGISGGDVLQLERALARLGFDPGRVDGVFDQQTSAAVTQWYRSKGLEPFGPTREQLANVRVIEREWGDAVKTKLAAAAAVDAAGLAVAAANAAATHSSRVAALESAVRLGEQRRMTDTQRASTSLTVENERAKAAYANTAADADVATQIAERAFIVLDPRTTETARRAADTKLELARAAREKVRLEGQLAVQAAERDATMAGERIEVARSAERSARLEGAKGVRGALDAKRLAEFDVRMATERVDQLATDLDLAKRKLGAGVPADEVVFLRTLPVRVEEVSAAIGAAATGSVMTVTNNQLAVDSSLPLDAAPLVKPGMRVAIDEQALGVKATGTVEMVANAPGTRGVDGFHIYLEVRVDSTPVHLEGYSVRLTIPTESTKGAVTAVPVSALSLTADGTSRVQVESNGTLEYVVVQPGLSANGYVEVNPENAKLAPGQLVVVGYKNLETREPK